MGRKFFDRKACLYPQTTFDDLGCAVNFHVRTLGNLF